MVGGEGGGQRVAVTLLGGCIVVLACTEMMPELIQSDNSLMDPLMPLATTVLDGLLGPCPRRDTIGPLPSVWRSW